MRTGDNDCVWCKWVDGDKLLGYRMDAKPFLVTITCDDDCQPVWLVVEVIGDRYFPSSMNEMDCGGMDVKTAQDAGVKMLTDVMKNLRMNINKHLKKIERMRPINKSSWVMEIW